MVIKNKKSLSTYELLVEAFKKRNVGRLKWAHAVNSEVKWAEATSDNGVTLIETDLMADEETGEIYMCNPPKLNRSFSFTQFMDRVIQTCQEKKIGVKLDCKDFFALSLIIPQLERLDLDGHLKHLAILWIYTDINPVLDEAAFCDSKECRILKDANEKLPNVHFQFGWKYLRDNMSYQYTMGELVRAERAVTECLEIPLSKITFALAICRTVPRDLIEYLSRSPASPSREERVSILFWEFINPTGPTKEQIKEGTKNLDDILQFGSPKIMYDLQSDHFAMLLKEKLV